MEHSHQQIKGDKPDVFENKSNESLGLTFLQLRHQLVMLVKIHLNLATSCSLTL